MIFSVYKIVDCGKSPVEPLEFPLEISILFGQFWFGFCIRLNFTTCQIKIHYCTTTTTYSSKCSLHISVLPLSDVGDNLQFLTTKHHWIFAKTTPKTGTTLHFQQSTLSLVDSSSTNKRAWEILNRLLVELFARSKANLVLNVVVLIGHCSIGVHAKQVVSQKTRWKHLSTCFLILPRLRVQGLYTWELTLQDIPPNWWE